MQRAWKHENFRGRVIFRLRYCLDGGGAFKKERGGWPWRIQSLSNSIGSEAAIAKTELVYRTDAGEETYLPYYRFYAAVTLPDEESVPGFQTYAAFYVPAVDSSYLTSLPVWSGSIHHEKQTAPSAP